MIEFMCSVDDGELCSEFCVGVCAEEKGIGVSTKTHS